MDFKNICEFWSLIEMHDLLVCNIIKTMPYNGCSQMVSISLKTKKSFIAHPWCLLSVVGLEKYSLGLVSRYSTVRPGTLTWREWGLCNQPLSIFCKLRPNSSKNTAARPYSSVRLSRLFNNVIVIVSSWIFQELLPLTKVMSMQKAKVKGQGHRGQNPY